MLPVGSVIPFAGPIVPEGWLLCDGSEVSRILYADLFVVIGTSWGAGEGSTTFHLPDLRGQFLRGVAGSAPEDPDKNSRTAKYTGGNTGNNVGSYEGHQIESHNHGPTNGNGFLTVSPDVPGATTSGSNNNTGFADFTANTGGTETRPVNAYVNYIIKY